MTGGPRSDARANGTSIDCAARHNSPPASRVCWRRMTDGDDPELLALLESHAALLEAASRLTVLSERLLRHAEPQLTRQGVDDARREIVTTRAALTQLDAMVTLRRQQLRSM